ncbi:WHG domain-containing protein [Tsukamurella sp. 8F]|uniref:TetR/AcrR family transcriptional regulator n=1 Tax=unclassified Tsukamurella TaxID=2633480 RepID=UPI0023B9D023|nr:MULTISPECIES: TetR family transcriptional regulator [unclassified Tsukamurella]MDF0531368.1 WHG domain-containing protein [Tsukamurella sp. 8J]MDF0588574.1 WHG domain-containing protein [Tsukamurella sp. 8F]
MALQSKSETSEVPTRMQRRVTEMRSRLVDTAETLLFEGGAQAVTADVVAQRADVSLQTVYNRVGGRQALLLAVAERALEQTREFMQTAYDGNDSVDERLRRVGETYIRLAFDRPQAFKIFANPPEDPESIEKIAALATEQHQRLTGLLREGIDAGVLAADLHPESAATALWGMLNGMLLVALRTDAMRPGSVTPESLVAAATTIIETGVRR